MHHPGVAATSKHDLGEVKVSGFPGPVERKDKLPAAAETLGGLREDVQCSGRVWALESARPGSKVWLCL